MEHPALMGQVSNKRTPPAPPQHEGNKAAGACVLSIVIVFVGVAAIIAGFVCAIGFDANGFLCVVCGLLAGLYNFALAVIVDACDKYSKS